MSIVSGIRGEYLTSGPSTLEGTGQSVSEQGVRKSLYQKVRCSPWTPRPHHALFVVQIVQAFPQGWISSGQISREGESQFSAVARRANTLVFSEFDEEKTREGVDGGRGLTYAIDTQVLSRRFSFPFGRLLDPVTVLYHHFRLCFIKFISLFMPR